MESGARRRSGLLFVLSGNMLLDALEVSAVVVALPAVGSGLGLPPATLQWLLGGFALGFGGLLLFGARVVERLGRRRVYLAALLVFGAASLLGGVTDQAGVLLATRFVKGFCVALTAPTGLAIIGSTFAEGPARDRALSVYSLFGAGGFTAGLLLSGALTSVGWRWTFLFPAPVALGLFVAGLWLVPRDEARADARGYDVAGAVAFTAAVGLLVFTIVTGPGTDWTDPVRIGSCALVSLLLGVFVHVERSARHPLVRLGVLAHRGLLRSALGAAVLNGSFWGFLFVCTLWLQDAAGWTPWELALAVLPASVLLTFAVPFSTRLVGRIGAARAVALGAVTPPLGYALMLTAPTTPSYATDVLPVVLLVGSGFAFAFSALHTQATAGIPAAEQGAASGVYQTSVQVGGAVVLAVVAALVVANSPSGVVSAATDATAFLPALLFLTALGAAGLLVALSAFLPPLRSAPVEETT